ncbi:N-acetyltransferase family protein [Brevibacillus ginsengisoli]|uniref:GNAT family N-acetyltransferase n=1 Tax=Brevibacillus ginsengisoli TaxID=363854 RepID=UPI003CEAFE2A
MTHHPIVTDIRFLQPEDTEQYLQLRMEGLQVNPESFGTTYEETFQMDDLVESWKKRLMPSSEVFTMGAFQEDRLISVATFVRESKFKFQHKGTIFGVYTTPTHRGQGVAKKLMQSLLDKISQSEGLEQVNLTVNAQNVIAIALYRSLGFEVFGTEKNAMKYEGKYWDENFMKLFIGEK